MQWSQVKLYTTTQALDIVTGFIISHGIRGVMIEDARDFEEFLSNTFPHKDYVDDALMEMKHCETAVIFYLPDNMQGIEMFQAVRSGLGLLRKETPDVDFGRLVLETEQVSEEDWSTAWKKYYHPVRVGKRLLICPSWEECKTDGEDIVVRLDPGMAFGTGTHETTRLCMEFLEECVGDRTTLLDIGTGSGILAVTALLLGAKQAVGIDIDALSVRIAHDNAELNGVQQDVAFCCGDLTEKVSGTYDIICANIVADVLIRLSASVTRFMRDDTILIVSGIIENRYEDVVEAMERAGLSVQGKKQENDWISLKLMRKQNASAELF